MTRLAALLALLLVGCGEGASTSDADASGLPPPVPFTGSPEVGSEVRLMNTAGQVVVCRDEATFKQFTTLELSHNPTAIRNPKEAAKLFSAKVETRAKVLEAAAPTTRLELLEGDFAGSSGWVSNRYLGR